MFAVIFYYLNPNKLIFMNLYLRLNHQRGRRGKLNMEHLLEYLGNKIYFSMRCFSSQAPFLIYYPCEFLYNRHFNYVLFGMTMKVLTIINPFFVERLTYRDWNRNFKWPFMPRWQCSIYNGPLETFIWSIFGFFSRFLSVSWKYANCPFYY